MRNILLIILFLTFGFKPFAQSLSDLSFGTDSTFEVMTWNIEHFPKNGQTTIDSLIQIIRALDIDVIALQEIDDKVHFVQLRDSLNLYGWSGYFVDSEYSGLAYFYKTDEIESVTIFEIYTTLWTEFPRAPLMMEMKFKNENLTIINNHFKCCGNGILEINNSNDEETRRLNASKLLDQYVSENYPNDRVIILGDLNDIITDSKNNNVFVPFIDNPKSYLFADMDIAEGSNTNWSYPSWPSHIDHILITNELFEAFADNTSLIETIQIDNYLQGGMNKYDDIISDHRPVAMKISNQKITAAIDFSISKNKLINYPNPFQNSTTILFNPANENTRIEIYNLNGYKIESFTVDRNQSSIIWETVNKPSGIFYAKLFEGNKIRATKKMVLLK